MAKADPSTLQLIDSKILTFVRDRMTHFLGDLEDDDLVNFVIQLLKDKSAPEAVVEGVEPVSETRSYVDLKSILTTAFIARCSTRRLLDLPPSSGVFLHSNRPLIRQTSRQAQCCRE